jgi:hypothetical protein
MKQINNMRQLRQRQRELQQATAAAANDIQKNWAGLKEAIRPSALAGEAIGHIVERAAQQATSDGILKTALLHGISQLAKNIVEKAATKLGKLLE